MSAYSDDLLRAASRLLARRSGQKGPLKGAYVRRSISTIYYAVFHFVLDEAATRLIGAHGSLRQRRRVYARTFTHEGLTRTFDKLKGATVNGSVAELFRTPGTTGAVATPHFVQQMATTFLDVRSKREDADYDLSVPLDATDALRLGRRVRRAIRDWRAATTKADGEFKHAVVVLLSLKGQLRS